MSSWLAFADLRATPPLMLAMLIGGMVLLVLLTPLVVEARAQAARIRRAMIDRHRVKLRAASLRRVRASQANSQNSLSAHLVRVLALLPAHIRTDNQRLLRIAGYCSPHATTVFWAIKGGILAVAGLGLLIHFFVLADRTGESAGSASWYLLLGLAFFIPDVVVKRQKKVRLQRLGRSLPDGLDLLVICAEAGLSLDAALKRVADEFITVVPELSEELLLTSVELNFLPDRRQALANLGNRVELPAFRGVVATLIQTEKYGTPLAQALRALASEFREHRLLAAEEKAARLPAILTVPMIVFILPALFIVLAAPAFIQVSAKFFSG
jgi:tight adherence protein C